MTVQPEGVCEFPPLEKDAKKAARHPRLRLEQEAGQQAPWRLRGHRRHLCPGRGQVAPSSSLVGAGPGPRLRSVARRVSRSRAPCGSSDEENLEVTVSLKNTGDAAALPLTVEGELLGESREVRLDIGVGPGVTRARGPALPERPAAAGGPRPALAAGVARGSGALDRRPPPHGEPEGLSAPDPRGRAGAGGQALGVSAHVWRLVARSRSDLESADGRPHRVGVRVAAPRGVNVEERETELEVPARGQAKALIHLLRAGAPRESQQGIVVVASVRDGELERTRRHHRDRDPGEGPGPAAPAATRAVGPRRGNPRGGGLPGAARGATVAADAASSDRRPDEPRPCARLRRSLTAIPSQGGRRGNPERSLPLDPHLRGHRVDRDAVLLQLRQRALPGHPRRRHEEEGQPGADAPGPLLLPLGRGLDLVHGRAAAPPRLLPRRHHPRAGARMGRGRHRHDPAHLRGPLHLRRAAQERPRQGPEDLRRHRVSCWPRSRSA